MRVWGLCDVCVCFAKRLVDVQPCARAPADTYDGLHTRARARTRSLARECLDELIRSGCIELREGVVLAEAGRDLGRGGGRAGAPGSGLVWSGLVWSGLVLSGPVWSGPAWSCLVLSGPVWSCLHGVMRMPACVILGCGTSARIIIIIIISSSSSSSSSSSMIIIIIIIIIMLMIMLSLLFLLTLAMPVPRQGEIPSAAVEPTKLGRVASLYYLGHRTVAQFQRTREQRTMKASTSGLWVITQKAFG